MRVPMTALDKVAMYIKLRDHKQDADKEFKKSMERVNQAMEKLEGELLAELEASGGDSIGKKGIGTVYIRVVSNVKTTNREAFLAWCADSDEWDALDVRPNKTIILEKLEEGQAVPGVDVSQARLIGVRRG